MSFFSSLQNIFVTTETFVVGVVAKFKADEAVLAKDAAAALGWIANNIPAAVQDLTQGVALIEALGVGTNPEVAAAVTAANIAVAGLNAFEAAYKAGSTDAATVAAGYVAIKQASATVASAVAAAAAAPVAK